MIYNLTFLSSALKEWSKLDPHIRSIFKSKLTSVLENPHIPKNQLSGLQNCYKIKLKSSGYRLVYRVLEDQVIVQVVAVGRRDKSSVYTLAKERLVD